MKAGNVLRALIVLLILAGIVLGSYYYHLYIFGAKDAVMEREQKAGDLAYTALVNTIEADDTEYAMTVLINPAFGGLNRGLERDGLNEADVVLKVARYVQSLNDNPSVRIVLTRDTDTNPTDAQRQELIDIAKPDIILDLHISDDEDMETMGTKVYYDDSYYDYHLTNDRLADVIERGIVGRCETVAAGISPLEADSNEFISGHKIPAVKVSIGYLSNALERQAMGSEAYLQNVALGIIDAITELTGEE